ncbi:catalase HPII [Methylobacillus gramineus]|uniref:catalase HPII n=1 Tax=Methylobacillus gramineus TaxID=755169 RepID=UPI001CFFD645|nr:catalase HPII [Methylobacillus gramineus]MCB5185887.1 catalase HPII [Methylobacillus gramineus]
MGHQDKVGKSQVAGADAADKQNANLKTEDLEQFKSDASGQALRTNQGVKIADDKNSLRAGARGPSLLEDFILREKITHFDHERIPERIVHARGVAAHGYFESYADHSALTKAGFLSEKGKQTPIFVRFSTVQGPRGSADTVRDVRGFALKFYTDEGNFDLVGNNIPVFFIQDAIKFPDFVHAVKPEPHNEIPTGGSAHDTFWDFVSLQSESAHAVIWAMSDRAIPKSLRTIQGFGVHTFRLINGEGVSKFVKFIWTPKQGVLSLVWDEAQKLAGKDADFHRRDLGEAIELGNYPEWEFGVQVIDESDEHNFDFDILDPTKVIPEELVPITPLGKLVLNRNPDNYFAETEQVAFCPGHIVPGIDFSNDPLLQGRLFSYTDTQLSRLGGPNFHEIPINKPVCPFHNNQRDALHRTTINKGQASYEPNSIDGGWPQETPPAAKDGGFESYYERIDAHKVRERSASFQDHFSQPRLFYKSLSTTEQHHIAEAYSFELGKVKRKFIRERVVNEILANIDLNLAREVAQHLGLPPPEKSSVSVPKYKFTESPALSQTTLAADSLRGKKVAALLFDGVSDQDLQDAQAWMEQHKVKLMLLGPSSAPVHTGKGKEIEVDGSFKGEPSILFDAVILLNVPGEVPTILKNGDVVYHLLEAYKHLKPVVLTGESSQLLSSLPLKEDEGLLQGASFMSVEKAFSQALLTHRVWGREGHVSHIPA